MKILRKLPPAEIIEDLLLVGMSTSYLWQFGCIWFEGVFCFQEPNIAIRTFETLMFVAILVFAIKRFIKHCRKGVNDGRASRSIRRNQDPVAGAE